MANATGSRHGLTYVAETVYGTIPATPTLKACRHTGTTLGLKRDSLTSEEIRSDRQLADFRLGQHQVGGDINVELSDNSHDDLLEALLGGTWATDVLKAGVLRKSFAFERFFSDITQYLRYPGCEVNSLSLQVSPGAITKATFGIVGQTQQAAAQTPIAGATYPAASTAAPYDGFVGTIKENNVAIAIVTEVSLSVQNNLQPMPVIGSVYGLQPSIGRSIVTGSISAYFQDVVLLNKFINETQSSLEFTLGGSGTGLTFLLPKIKYTGGQPDVSGEGPITLSLPFQALYDTTEATNIKITRNAT